MSAVIGIDLGTSTTEAAVIHDGKPEMIVNLEHEIITPSAVGIDSAGNRVVGEKARAQYLLSPENTAIEIKRRMGTDEKIALGRQKFTPIELSAQLLEYVRTYASEYLEDEVVRAVISVPAYFDDIQRQATVEAGTRAGFQVERIINEPTAAALTYGVEHMEEESHILVYDLGGGTFDVTLLEMFDGVLEVKASSGDNQLGGKDFDQKLMDYLSDCFYEKHKVRLEKDKYALVKLKEAAEECKKALSEEDSYHVLVPMILEYRGEPLALDEVVTAERFAELSAELMERTHKPIDVVLADSGVTADGIDKIILVGGSTRMPVVAKDIEAYLHQTPVRVVNPDYAVAQGAAVQAGIIEGSIRPEENIVMTDVNPYTLGVRVEDGWTDERMSVVIPRNVTIPTTRSEVYYTSWDNQTKADIEVYQGESRLVTSNHFLGSFCVQGIPPRKRGEESIRVEFSYDLNGMLAVKAIIVSTGAEASIVINMMEDGENPAAVDVSRWKESPIAKNFRTVIRRAEKRLKDSQEVWDKEEVEQLLYELKEAIVDEDLEEAMELEEELMDLL